MFQRLPGELAKQLLMSGGGGGGSHDVAAAMRKAVAFCERKFCEANLPSADNADEVADLEGACVFGTGGTSRGALAEGRNEPDMQCSKRTDCCALAHAACELFAEGSLSPLL